MTARDLVTDALTAHGSRHHGGGMWNCPGPGHANGDRKPSLHVTDDSRGVGLYCHWGCTVQDVTSALGLDQADLFDQPLRQVARYDYRDPANGAVLYTKIRYEPKTFRVVHLNGNGTEVGGIGTALRVLYRLAEARAAIARGEPVWCVEGEADADRLAALGIAAVCNHDGASREGQRPKWHPEYTEQLAGACEVIIVADRDEPGYAHARAVAQSLAGKVPVVRVLRTPLDRLGADVSDHLDAGLTLDQLEPVPDPGAADITARIRRGGCILDAPRIPEPVWGKDEDLLWACGQALIVAGHDGTGKTTLAGNLIRARLGLPPGTVLGLPVTPGRRNVLVLMMDRPQQAMSSLARLFTEDDRQVLDERLRIWAGPPPVDLAQDTGLLARLCALADADTCVVDSLKDAAIPLTDDAVGAGWNRARQTALTAGTELLELHHPRKPALAEQNKPPELSDLYGSRWIPAGIGSAVILHGRPGEPYVKLFHRKPVISVLGPWDVLIGEDGQVQVDQDQADMVRRIARHRKDGVTAAEAALMLYASDTPSETERARRQLEKLVRDGRLSRQGGTRGGSAAIYRILGQPPEEITEGITEDSQKSRAASSQVSEPATTVRCPF